MAKDLYDVLGVARTATKDEIRKTFKKLARELHPDVKPGDKKAEQRFKEITAAYSILSDDDKRKLYDEFGEVALKTGFDAKRAREAMAAGGGFGGGFAGGSPFPEGFDFSGFGFPGGGFRWSSEGGEDDFEDFLSSMLGGRRGRGGRRRGAEAGSDVETTLEIDLPTSLEGGATRVTLEKPRACPSCGGNGTAGGETSCPACGGRGRVPMGGRRGGKAERACSECDGSGRVSGRCPSCGGAGQVVGPETVEIKIPPGVRDGQKLRLSGLGTPGRAGGPAGDLYVRIAVRPHPSFERQGDDLHVEVPITIPEAVAGATVDLPLPGGGTVSLKVPPLTQSGRRFRLRGLGARGRDGKGDLIARVLVRIPDQDGPELRELAKKLGSLYAGDVRSELER